MAKVFVGDLTHDATEESVHRQFREFGAIADIKLRKEPKSNKAPSAVVTFVERGSADIAVTVCKENGQRVWQIVSPQEARYESWLADGHVLTDKLRDIDQEPIVEWEGTGRPGTKGLNY